MFSAPELVHELLAAALGSGEHGANFGDARPLRRERIPRALRQTRELGAVDEELEAERREHRQHGERNAAHQQAPSRFRPRCGALGPKLELVTLPPRVELAFALQPCLEPCALERCFSDPVEPRLLFEASPLLGLQAFALHPSEAILLGETGAFRRFSRFRLVAMSSLGVRTLLGDLLLLVREQRFQ